MKRNAARILAAIVIAGSVVTMAGGCSKSQIEDVVNIATSDQAKVRLVKNGYFESYPDKSIGDAFGAFFGSPTWQEFTADSGEQVVEFNGNFMYLDKETKATIQFVVDEDAGTFELYTIEFNEVPQNKLMQSALISKVYGDE